MPQMVGVLDAGAGAWAWAAGTDPPSTAAMATARTMR